MPNKTAQPDWLETAAKEAREVIARLHAEATAAFDTIDSPATAAPKPESGP